MALNECADGPLCEMCPKCPACGSHRWWTEFRAGGMTVLLGSFGRPAFSCCYDCGHQEARSMEPPPWPPGTVFPTPDPPED